MATNKVRDFKDVFCIAL